MSSVHYDRYRQPNNDSPEYFRSMLAERYHMDVLLRCIVTITILEYEGDIVFKILRCYIYVKRVEENCQQCKQRVQAFR